MPATELWSPDRNSLPGSGSEAAILTAIHAPDAVQGVVATVPANVIAGSHPPGGPAWLRNGHPLPYADHQGPGYENPEPSSRWNGSAARCC